MRPPTLPVPTVAPRPAVTGKQARKSPPGGPANQAARKAESSHESAAAHKAHRRKSSASDKAGDDSQAPDDFAAMLAQTAAQPAAMTPAQTPVAGSNSSDSDAVTDSSAALLRPWETLTAALGTGADADANGELAAADATAATPTTAPAATPASTPASAAEPGLATAVADGPIAVPSELASAAAAVTASAPDAAAGVQRADNRDAARRDQPVATAAVSSDMTDPALAAAGAHSAATSGDRSTGDQPASGQPDFAGAAAAAGVQHSPAGVADKVSESPMPAHTVAPTIAQVAHSLRTSVDGTSRLVIRLDPVELGPVLVTLRTRGGAVDISVRADNAGGASAVADQRAHIQQVLADHGLDLSSFNVSGGDASGGAGSSTTDADQSGGSGDNSSNSNGPDPNAASYDDVQGQASGADGQGDDGRASAPPRENVGLSRANGPTTSSDGATATPVRTVRREGTWL
jgi:flagellar hook-length control protein FliK